MQGGDGADFGGVIKQGMDVGIAQVVTHVQAEVRDFGEQAADEGVACAGRIHGAHSVGIRPATFAVLVVDGRAERAARIERQGKVNLQLDAGERSGRQVIVAENLSFAHAGGAPLVQDFSDIIERGEKIGLVGANGAGKTTLLRLLLGELPPTAGRLKHGTKLEVAYFDQLRAQLDPEETLRDSVGAGRDYIETNGQRKHIAAYLQDFLFPPERWRTPVGALSGGERARLLLARLFAQPANVLVLDEPTNDLDIETLELLEEVLADYPGTVLLVSHDRAFLDAVVTRLWVFNRHKGKIEQIVGGFSDWLQQGGDIAQLEEAAAPAAKTAEKPAAPADPPAEKRGNKLSYKYQRELEALPAQIEAAEAEVARLTAAVQEADFYQQPQEAQQAGFAALEAAQQQLDALVERWMQLEDGERHPIRIQPNLNHLPARLA